MWGWTNSIWIKASLVLSGIAQVFVHFENLLKGYSTESRPPHRTSIYHTFWSLDFFTSRSKHISKSQRWCWFVKMFSSLRYETASLCEAYYHYTVSLNPESTFVTHNSVSASVLNYDRNVSGIVLDLCPVIATLRHLGKKYFTELKGLLHVMIYNVNKTCKMDIPKWKRSEVCWWYSRGWGW